MSSYLNRWAGTALMVIVKWSTSNFFFNLEQTLSHLEMSISQNRRHYEQKCKKNPKNKQFYFDQSGILLSGCGSRSLKFLQIRPKLLQAGTDGAIPRITKAVRSGKTSTAERSVCKWFEKCSNRDHTISETKGGERKDATAIRLQRRAGTHGFSLDGGPGPPKRTSALLHSVHVILRGAGRGHAGFLMLSFCLP